MANPGATQASFTALFNRLAVILAAARLLEPIEDLFSRALCKVIEHDPNSNTTTWTLTGLVPGTNTDAAGKIYVRIVANAGNWDVNLYKATGGGAGDKVATAVNVAAGATATLTASNSSGLTGSVVLAGSVTAETTDLHILECFRDFPSYARAIFDGSETEDPDMLDVLKGSYRTITAAIRGARGAAASVLQNQKVREYIGRIIKAENRQPFLNKRVSVDADGTVTLNILGLAEDLRDAMQDNTTVQKVAVTTLSAGSVTYDSSNQGVGVLTVGAINPNMLPGQVIVKCADETVGTEEFDVSFESDDGKVSLRGQRRLRIGEEWNDPDLAVSLTLARTFDKNGTDGTNVEVAAASLVTGVTGLSADNSDDGTFYGKVVANGSNWNFEFYRASGLASADLVAKATNIATGALFTATQQNSSGLTIAWKAGSGPTNGNTFQLDCNPWKQARVGQGADQAYFAISRSAKGEWQEEARKQFDGAPAAVANRTGYYFHQAASPTIADSVLTKNSTLFPETA